MKPILLILIFSGSAIAQQLTATTGMIADVVKNVAGPGYDVQSLMGPGVDPHLYKLTRSDMVKLTSSDIVFYNGLLLEGKMTDALLKLKNSGRTVVAVAEEVEDAEIIMHQGEPDPHLWMDPVAWLEVAGVIHKTLCSKYPERTEVFDASLAKYENKIRALHVYSQQITSSIPEKSRVLITAHDAFGYFGKRYDVEVIGIQGISTESEAGVREIERLVELLVDRNVPAVFIESTVSTKNVNALIEGAKAKGHSVVIGGELFSDAMGKPGTYTGTYSGMIDHNVTTITKALGGMVPKTGFPGK